VAFGYIDYSSEGFENPPVNGIWGISYPDLAVTTPAIDYLISQENLPNTFSLCVSNDNPIMSIGIDYSTNNNFQWTPIVKQEYYNVNMTDLKVGGVSLDLSWSAYSSPRAIVDSGTTLMLLTDTGYNALLDALNAMCPGLHGLCDAESGQGIFDGYCYTMTGAQLDAYPTVSVVLEGVSSSIDLPPSQYLFQVTENNQQLYCGGFGSAGSEGSILGDVFMTGNHFVFDRKNSKIGIGALSTCPAVGTSSATGTGGSTLTPSTGGSSAGVNSAAVAVVASVKLLFAVALVCILLVF